MSFSFSLLILHIHTQHKTPRKWWCRKSFIQKKNESNQGSHILSRVIQTFLSLVPLIILHDIFPSARTHQTHTHALTHSLTLTQTLCKHFICIFWTKLEAKQIYSKMITKRIWIDQVKNWRKQKTFCEYKHLAI